MTEFTKGPWSFVDGIMAPYFVIKGVDLDEDSQIVVGSTDCIENHANGHLIAAAPDMYEALRGLQACVATLEGMLKFRVLSPPETPSYVEAKEAAIAALAKARGES